MSLQHLFFPSTPGQLLTRAGAGTARDIGVHVFTFVFGDNDDGALYHSVDTSVGDADREVRMTASDNRLTVVDSELGTTTQPGDGDDADGASDVIETVQAVLVWTPPTVEESEQLCKAMLESVASKSKKGEAAWEKKLASLLEEQTRGRASLAALAAAEKSLAVPEKPMRRKFLLRLTRPQTAVFAPLCTDKDVQIVYSKPSYEGSKKIGAEERSMIEIEEERDGWLRYRPQPGDPLQSARPPARARPDSNLSLSCAQLTCQTSRPAVLCAWFQRLHQTVSVSFPGTRATKEAGHILHPSSPVRKRTRCRDSSTNSPSFTAEMTLGGSASAGDGNENAAKESCRTSQTRTPSPHPDRSATEPLRIDPPGSAIQTDPLDLVPAGACMDLSCLACEAFASADAADAGHAA